MSPPSAGVAKLADARDSKSREAYVSCGFDSHLRHINKKNPEVRSQNPEAGERTTPQSSGIAKPSREGYFVLPAFRSS